MSQRAKKKKKAKQKKISFKDKDWYEVIAPKSFNFKSIGEIIGLENSIMNRVIECILFEFTDDFNDINLKLRFKTIDINEEAKKCNTVFTGHQYTNDYVRSLIGRGSTKVQTIDNLTTKDNFTFRVTTVCTTLKRARNSQMIIIRKIMRDILIEFSKSLNHEKFIRGMIYGEFENQIKRVAKTIFPLTNCTVIRSKLISIPEGGVDTVVPDDDFEIVVDKIDVKRSRKSEMKRTERINVKKLTNKPRSRRGAPAPAPKPAPKPAPEAAEPEAAEEKEKKEE